MAWEDVGWTELAPDKDKAWGFCESGNETLGSIKRREISWLSKEILALQRLCSMHLVGQLHFDMSEDLKMTDLLKPSGYFMYRYTFH